MSTDPFADIELEPADDELQCLDPACPDFGSPDFGEGTCPPSHAQPPNGPFRDGKVWVLNSKCLTCIYRPGNLMHLRPGQRDQIAGEAVKENSVIPCHETLDGPRSVCRGYYDVHKDDTMPLRLARGLDMIAFDPPPAKVDRNE